jgi:hypothetical protein
LVCNSFNHSPHCPRYRNNALKGASNVNQPKQLMFNSSEVNILSKSLEICKYYIGKNQAQFQNQDILNEISTSISIISARQNKNNSSNLKGASSNKNKICNETKRQSLQNILKLFNLT